MHIYNGLFTSEAVSAGHPDKLCDRISDTILDAYIALDPDARVACETFALSGRILVAGEFRAKDGVAEAVAAQAEELVRQTIREVGYGTAEHDIDPNSCRVELCLNAQSPEIGAAVDGAAELGAGDQGIMFGFACDETPELMPLAWSIANDLVARAVEMNERSLYQRGGSPVRPLRPDGKTQVTVRYENGQPVGVQSVVISWQHDPAITLDQVRSWLERYVVDAIVPVEKRTPDFALHLNPAGTFIIGGPKADTGLTGRKIIVDTYGGAAPHGGGAFSGKDPSKVDRSAAYAARWVAKNIVAAGLAKRATVQLSYAIGLSRPISVVVNTEGTGTRRDEVISQAVSDIFDLSPAGIISALDLKRAIYRPTSSLGHFGKFREAEGATWEQKDRAARLVSACPL